MNPDIIVKALDGEDGAPGPKADDGTPTFFITDFAQGGTCKKENWGGKSCVCAVQGLSGGNGNTGNTGGVGSTPAKCPTLCVIVGRLASDLLVRAEGGDGGIGGPGSNGGNGGNGQNGGINDPYALKGHGFSSAQCHPTIGGLGGNAGSGGNGGPGGGGGEGGDIYVYYTETQSIVPNAAPFQVLARSVPGQIGRGGAPGKAGQPGLGGFNEPINGSSTRYASGRTANDGGQGLNGAPAGTPGIIQVINLPAF